MWTQWERASVLLDYKPKSARVHLGSRVDSLSEEGGKLKGHFSKGQTRRADDVERKNSDSII